MAEKGVLLAGEGLLPSLEGLPAGAGGKRVVDGPFAETKELIAGLLPVRGRLPRGGGRRSWAGAAPPTTATPARLEIRQVA